VVLVTAEAPPLPSVSARGEGYDDDAPRLRRERAEREPERRPRVQPDQTSGKAVGALICGLLTFLLPILAAIPAVILGFMAQGDIKRSGGRLAGGGMALAGIVLGFVGNLVLCPVFILVPAVQKVREAAARTQTMNNFKQIALAMHNYHDVHGQLPPAVVYDQNGKPLYSWRVLVLPFIEQDNLYRQFKLDEAWDGPNNIRLLQQMPPTYMHPGAGLKDPTQTFFQVVDGPSGGARPRAMFASKTGQRVALHLAGAFGPPPNVFQSDHRMRFQAVPDGTSNTIMLVEAAESVPWTKPADVYYEPGQPLPKLGGHFGSGFIVGLGDGSVRLVPRSVSDNTLRAAITADDGIPLGPDW
jgi:hypothetical protein